MAYTKRGIRRFSKRRYAKKKKTLNEKWKKSFVKMVRETMASEHEKKQVAYTANAQAFNASEFFTGQLTDIVTGANNNSRVGNEIIGHHFEGALTFNNGTANDLYIRVALLQMSGIGETVDIDGDTTIIQSPMGDATNLNDATGLMANAAVMWPYNQQGAVKVLKEKIIKLPKNGGTNDSSSRTVKWWVPWHERIRYVSPLLQGANNQSKRVSLFVTAWSPSGGDQADYTYTVDALMRFFFVDS